MSFVQKLAKERALVYYIRSTPSGKEPSWFFLRIYPFKREAFDRVMSGVETFDLKDYGEILHSGYGEASKALKKQMRDEYGVEYDE